MACIVTEKAFFGNDSLPQKSANPKHRWVIGQRMTPYASKIHPNSQKIQKFLPTAAFLFFGRFPWFGFQTFSCLYSDAKSRFPL
jgi:hypothetical protein